MSLVTKLTLGECRRLSTEDINNYIDTINIELGEKIPKSNKWKDAATNLLNYLNAHGFRSHKGITINDDTIDDFITRIISENKTDDLNFLPNNKLDSEMNQEGEQPVNPLAQLVQDTISVNDLIGIYNRYAPNPITEQQL